MQNLYEINTSSILGVKVDEKDLEVISETLIKAASEYYIRKEHLNQLLKVHWTNLFKCLEIASSEDGFLFASRNNVFNEAMERQVVEVIEEKKDIIYPWALALKREIEEGRLKHFVAFKDCTLEQGSIYAKIKGIRYSVDRKKINRFFKVAKRKLQSFNLKAYNCIDEFVEWAFDRSKKPWLSTLFFGVIMLLVLFTVTVIWGPSISFGILVILYRVVYTVCVLCTLYYSLSYVTEALDAIGLSKGA